MYGNRSYHFRSRSRDAGYEAAMQHIEEARRLTRELGGTDQDVKQYFFSLPASERMKVLDAYGREFGRDKQSYAEKTFNDWKSGRRKMSGLVATRLFRLLPPRMSLKKKYELVESLWRHLGPSSSATFTVGSDVSADEVIRKVTAHTISVVTEFEIPENFERRFEWLAAGDVSVRQKLLNHFQELERQAIIFGAQQQVPAVMDHLASSSSRLTQSAAQDLKIGNHNIRLEFSKDPLGIIEGSIRPKRLAADGDGSLLGWIVGAAIIIGLMFMLGG